MTTGLSTVESWDLPALRGAVAGLADVPDRLAGWGARVEGLQHELRAAELWSGPAADVAATALVELAAVTHEVRAALGGSAESLQRVVAEAHTAVEEAAVARVTAATGPVELSDAGVVAPLAAAGMAADQLAAVVDREEVARRAEAHARAALAAADAVLAAAGSAALALLAVGVVDGLPAPSFADVAATAAASAAPPVVPPGRDPAAAAAWWAGLTPAARLAAIDHDPAGVGALDGLPAWARDRANRLLLREALAGPAGPARATALATRDALAGIDDDGGTSQLLVFDADEGLVGLSTDDLDTAEAVSVLVPGINTTAPDDLPGLVSDAQQVSSLAEAAAPGLAAASLVWLGYRTPTTATAPLPTAAAQAGPALDSALDGLAASRAQQAQAGGPRPPRTTVVAHSYGTLVTARAAGAAGELAADAVVLLGSPGTGVPDAAALEAAEVHGAWSDGDWISRSGWFGPGPADPGFGDTDLPTLPGEGHSDYYDPAFPTVAAVAEVVAGTRAGR